MRLDDNTIARFNAKVDRSGGPDACHPWTASCRPAGYGQFVANGNIHLAHRVAYEIAHGPLPADKPLACHKCDNPPCCNPAHLFAGTQAENMRDAVRKGRMAHGLAHAMACHPLTNERRAQIAAVFELRGEGLTLREIGGRVGMSHAQVSKILNGTHWSGITAHLRAAPDPASPAPAAAHRSERSNERRSSPRLGCARP